MKLPRVNFPRFISQFMTLNETERQRQISNNMLLIKLCPLIIISRAPSKNDGEYIIRIIIQRIKQRCL